MKRIIALAFSTVLVIGCSKDEPSPLSINTPTIELHYDEEHQYIVKKGEAEVFASALTWTSSNEKIGTVDANGKFEARTIGETIIKGTSGDGTVESKVTVAPYVKNIVEPVIKFGVPVATIKSEEKRKIMREDAEGIAFEGSLGAMTRYVLYLLKDGKVTGIGMMMETNTTTATLLGKFLAERYPIQALQNGVLYSFNDDQKYAVGTTVNSSLGLVVSYVPLNTNGRVSGSDAVHSDAIIKGFERLLTAIK